ncbi:MAG: sulfotransferase [Phycisphaeraceae bacterium]|nr:sulfotransferase [Phycisphaeraceae bacterium]
MRSGTTLLRLMLNSHPDIHVFAEFEESVKWLGDSGWLDLDLYRQRLRGDRSFSDEGFTIDQSIADYPALVHSFVAQAAARTNKRRIGFCVHTRFDRIPDLWPGARLIHMVRDPRDVARSCVQMGWVGTVWHGCDHWLESEARFERMRDRLAPGSFVDLRYEDLLRDPHRALDHCCSLVATRFHPSMLEFHKTSTYEPLDASLVEQWRRRLSPRQIRHVQSRCAVEMLARGYAVESPPGDRRPGAAGRLGLAMAHRINRFRHSARRYGFWLALGRIARRRLPLPRSWNAAIVARAQAVERSHLR